MAFNTNVTRFNWVTSIFPCCQPRNGPNGQWNGPAGGNRGRRSGGQGWTGASYAFGDLDISSPSNTMQSKTMRFYGMQPFPDPIVSQRNAARSVSPFSEVGAEAASEYTLTSSADYGHSLESGRISIRGVDHYLGAGIPRDMLGEKLERLLGENLLTVPEDGVCPSQDFLKPTTYLLSISSKGQTRSNGSGITTTDLDGGLELIVQGTDQMDCNSGRGDSYYDPQDEARPTLETSYTATFLLDDINGGSQAALADFLKNLSRQSTDNSTLASRTTSATEWVLQPLRPAPRSVSPSSMQTATTGTDYSTAGASTELCASNRTERRADMLERRATLRRRDTGSTLELKLINIERTPSKASSKKPRKRGDSSHRYTSTEAPPNIPTLPSIAALPGNPDAAPGKPLPRPPKAVKRPPSLQLPGRGASVTAVARRGGHQEGDHYSKPTPVEKRSNRCGCGRSPRPEYGDDGKALPIAVGGSRVQSWVVGQQKYYRVKRHPGATSPTHPTGNDGQDISQGVSRYPIQTGEYELLSPRSLFFEASPSLAEPSPAYTGSYDNIILSLSPKPALYPCPCYEEAPEYQEVDPNPASFYNATSRSAERRKSYVGYHDKR